MPENTTGSPTKTISASDFDIFQSMYQSMRARNGHDFNDDVSMMLLGVADGKDVLFVKAEPEFKKNWSKRGFKCKPIYLKMDHWFLIADHDKKEVLSILSDGTTTFRNDRAKIKRSEGVDQMRLKDEIEAKLLEEFPQFVDYTITHLNVFVFPSELGGHLKRKTKEARAIREFSVNTNHSTNEFRSYVGCHQIDAAMTINEMENVITEIASNKFRYSFTQNAFANAWKFLYNTHDYLPSRELTIDNAKNHKDHLIYCLKTNPSFYSRRELNEFAAASNIESFNWKLTNAAKIGVIVGHIMKNY